MIDIRPFDTLGHANHGWLDARHHFSFASYHDPDRMGWGNIRVWNDDTIAAQSGFPPHPHNDMEIVTFVRSGAITHQDSLGNKGRTAAGDVQVMSAGTGITHAEYNVEDEATTLFQIWILPDRRGHYNGCRPEQAIPQAVAFPGLLEYDAFVGFIGLFAGHGLVLGGIERLSDGVDFRDTGLLKGALELGVDHLDPGLKRLNIICAGVSGSGDSHLEAVHCGKKILD